MKPDYEDIKVSYPVFSVYNPKLITGYNLYTRLIESCGCIPENIFDYDLPLRELIEGTDYRGRDLDEYVYRSFLDQNLIEIMHNVGLNGLDELRISVGVFLGEGLWENNLEKLINEPGLKLTEFPVSQEALYKQFKDLNMDSAIAFRFVKNLADGRGLSDDMRDELWMDFAPDWLTAYCEKIKELPTEQEIWDYMKILLTVLWYGSGERVNGDA